MYRAGRHFGNGDCVTLHSAVSCDVWLMSWNSDFYILATVLSCVTAIGSILPVVFANVTISHTSIDVTGCNLQEDVFYSTNSYSLIGSHR